MSVADRRFYALREHCTSAIVCNAICPPHSRAFRLRSQREKRPVDGASGQAVGNCDCADRDGGDCAADSCGVTGSAGTELGCLTVCGSCSFPAGGRFCVDAFFASSLGVFVASMPNRVASGTSPSPLCPSWLAILDTVSFNSSIKVHPARPSPAATTIETRAVRAQACMPIPSLIRGPNGGI
jgi:hypothetical protein